MRCHSVAPTEAQPLQPIPQNAPDVPVIEIVEQDKVLIMQRVVEAARSIATDGDVVLLAPAAASMDQFKDYADRGHRFADAVRAEFGVTDGR